MIDVDEQAKDVLVTMSVDEQVVFLGVVQDDHQGKFTLTDRAMTRWLDTIEGFNSLDVWAGYNARIDELDAKELTWPPTLPQLVKFIRPYHARRHEWIFNYLEAARIAEEQGDDDRAAWARGQAAHWASTAEATL
jgi:hypothetical protein